MTWHAKEATRNLYDLTDPDLAEEYLCELAIDIQDQSHPPEVQSLGRTLARWFDEIVAWHKAFVSNGPTEAVKSTAIRNSPLAAFGVPRGRTWCSPGMAMTFPALSCRSGGEGFDSFAAGGVLEADRFARGLNDVGVVQQPVD